MVKTRSGAGGSPQLSKRVPSKIIKKEPPKKRLLSMNDFTEVILDFNPKPQSKICILPKFISELQNLPSAQNSPALNTLNIPFESPRQCWTPLPYEEQKMSISTTEVDAILSSLQQNVPSETAGVRRYELFVKDAPIEATPDDILRKWLSKVFRSGMPWMGALSQLPMSLRNQARKIMIRNHAILYL